jgi:cell filamentation protein
LAEFEAVSTVQRADEPLPVGRLSVRHYRAIHHHLFQDVYAWAGKFRTVRLGKERSAFCYF